MRRLYPIFVSVLGVLGLASALSYLVLAVLAFQSGYSELADFLVGIKGELSFGFLLFGIPYVLLVLHLYLRTRLGHWMVDRGWAEDAIGYCEDRLTPGILRSRKEVLAHRVALGRAHAYRGDYANAWHVLADAGKPLDGAFAAELMRWRLEIALRRENLVDAHDVFDSYDRLAGAGSEHAAILACAAEMAAREQDRAGYDEHLQSGRWIEESHDRLKWAEMTGTLQFGDSESQWRAALDVLPDLKSSRVWDELPLRRGEILAVAAHLHWKCGEPDAARECLTSAEHVEADSRAAFVVSAVAEVVSPESTGEQA